MGDDSYSAYFGANSIDELFSEEKLKEIREMQSWTAMEETLRYFKTDEDVITKMKKSGFYFDD